MSLRKKYIQNLLWVLLSFLAPATAVMAQSHVPVSEFMKQLTGSTLAVNASITVENEKYFNSAYSANIDTPYPVKNVITCKLNEASNVYFQAPFTATLRLRMIYTTAALQQDSVERDFVVGYDTAAYKSQDIFAFKSAHRVIVRVLSVSVNSSNAAVTAAVVVPNLVVENKMQVQPKYKFNCTTVVTTLTATDSAKANADELYVSWNDITGAHEYDLEWVFIDSSAIRSHVYGNPLNTTAIFDNNATRVSITGTRYAIPLLYNDTGVLFIRVRPVQYAGEQRFEAGWSSGTALAKYAFTGHEPGLNWQSTVSYAEEGKRKAVVQYYDGSLRSRQTVTKDNTTNTTIVGESFYDYQGRAVVQVLPVPSISNIIGYSRQFNVGLNGAEYEKNDFDTLTSAGAFCNAGAAAMGTQNGASKYYSPSNPDLSGLNAYIPDAAGYPFTETQYTQDATGRIAKQSGVGSNYRLGSNHETKYYYSTPTQNELDALFGTEAGDYSHYFKNAVQDANGQFSVSYVDMHGRTVATALAGASPGGMDDLSSHNTVEKTESLIDSSGAIFRDRIIEHKKSLLVETQGDHVFHYQLNPETLIKEACAPANTPICYSCLYDLKITITDDCNNQKLPDQKMYEKVVRNFSIGDITSGCTAQNFNLEFTLNLAPGNYEITKQLSISQYGQDYYRENIFIPNNTCRTLESILNEQRSIITGNRECAPSCATCMEKLGNWNSYRDTFMLKAGIAPADSAANRGLALAAFNEALTACKELCNTNTDAEDLRAIMLQEVTPPAGLYANVADTSKPYSIFYASAIDKPSRFQQSALVYLDATGNKDSAVDSRSGTRVAPNTLNVDQFSDQFKASWATTLLPLHPEYCKLLRYEQDSLSAKWDKKFEQTTTFREARVAGYLNPLGNSAVPFPLVTANKDPLTGSYTNLTSKLNDYQTGVNIAGVGNNVSLSMWVMATMSVRLTGTDTAGTYQAYAHPFDTTVMCEGELDAAWQHFRTFYLQAKKSIMNTLVNNACPVNGTTNPSANTLLTAGFTPHFAEPAALLSNSGYGYATNTSTSEAVLKDSAQKALDAQYDANCKAYALLWAQQLAPCNYDSIQLHTVIIPKLIQVCKEGSDPQHPTGSSTVKPSSTYAYRSFEQVLKEYNQQHGITNSFTCSPELVTAPKPYDHPAVYNNIAIYTKPDSCQCSTIQALYSSYQPVSAYYSSFSAYVKAARNTDISDGDLTTLLNMCNNTAGSCNYLAKPLMLPPALQCGMQNICASCIEIDTLYNRFKNTYTGLTPSLQDTSDQQHLVNQLFASYMNNRLGFAKESWEYLSFRDSCGKGGVYSASTCNNYRQVVHRYDIGLNESALASIQPSNDGGYIMAGSLDDLDGVKRAYVVKTDKTGSIQWSKVYGNTGTSSFIKVIPASDSGYLAIGSTTAYSTASKVLIVRMNENGGVSWARTIGNNTTGGEYGRGIIPLTGNSLARGTVSSATYAFVGGYDYRATAADVMVGVITGDGDISWMKRTGSSDSDDGGALVENGDTLVVAATTYRATNATTGAYDGALYKFNKFTGEAHSLSVYQVSSPTYNYFSNIANVAGGYRVELISGDEWDVSGAGIVTVLTVNNAGAVTAKKSFDKLPGNNVAVHHAYTSTADGGYLLAHAPRYAPQDIYFTRVSATNDVLWTRQTNIPGDQTVSSIITGVDSGFALVGSMDSHGMFMKVDSAAGTGCFDSTLLLTSSEPTVVVVSGYLPQVNDTLNRNYMSAVSLAAVSISSPGSLGARDSIFCGTCTPGYSGAYLCGSVKGVFDAQAIDEVNNCTDTSFFIQSKSIELYQLYADSLKGSFDKDYVQKCMNAYRYESFTVEHKVSEYHYTLYYYDQAGNLAKTVPPAGVHANRDATWLSNVKLNRAAGIKQVPAHEMVTWYAYNTLNQVVQQQTPDASVSNFWYDRLGRLAVSQNRKQALANQYSYTYYDYLGRISQVGQLTSTAPVTDVISRNDASLQQWFTNVQTSREQITVTVYDDAYAGTDALQIKQANLRNRVAYTQFYNTAADLVGSGNPYASATFYSYDIHGNVDTLLQDYKAGVMSSNGNRFKKMVYQYDLISGKVNHVAYQPGAPDGFYHRYTYDAENRLTNVETSRDSVYWENDAWYKYYKHGPLARSVIGQQQVQGLDYAYTLQGWIKAVNPEAAALSTGGASGTGGNCAAGSAVNDLVVNVREADGPDTYTARSSISFQAGFDSEEENFEGIINSALAVCTPAAAATPDGNTATGAAQDAFQYVLHYNNTDYKPINAVKPDVLAPAQLGSDYRPLYNGNISGMGVIIGKLNAPVWYNYKYDQLNRLVQMDAWNTGNANWSDLVKSERYHEGITYDANGNILAYQRNGNKRLDSLVMDNLTYHYETGKNRLTHIADMVPENYYTEDIDDQAAGNYEYDSIGNLTKDTKAGLNSIEWTVYGKIKAISKTGQNISYTYDASGNRISKTVGNAETTWYVRDAQGNVMSVYSAGNSSLNSGHLSQTEVDLYGSSRLGILKTSLDVTTTTGVSVELPKLGEANGYAFTRGNKLFELSNHLGNVLATVSDRKIPVSGNGTTIDYYNADVVSAQDYYPFGMLQPGRSYNAGGYRYGFNGKENDNEVKGEGNQQDYGMRIYDSRIGKFLSVDPLTKKYPWYTPYQFAGNSPIEFIDRDGEEPWKRKELQALAKMNEGIVATTITVSQAAGISSARGHGMAVDQNGNTFYYHSTTGLAAHMASMQTNVSMGISLGYSLYNKDVDLTMLSGQGQSQGVSGGPGAVSGGYGIEMLPGGQPTGHTFSVGLGKGLSPMDASASKSYSTGLILTGNEYDKLYQLDNSVSSVPLNSALDYNATQASIYGSAAKAPFIAYPGSVSGMTYSPLNDKNGTVEIVYTYTMSIQANAAVNPGGKDVLLKQTIRTGITGVFKDGVFQSNNYKPAENVPQNN